MQGGRIIRGQRKLAGGIFPSSWSKKVQAEQEIMRVTALRLAQEKRIQLANLEKKKRFETYDRYRQILMQHEKKMSVWKIKRKKMQVSQRKFPSTL